jgi:hypothetical protein
LASFEISLGEGIADVIAVGKSIDPKLAIIEVKRTRADLLQDLRAKKYLKYEKNSTHVYLACTAEAFKYTGDDLFEDLQKRGVPKKWGLLLITPSDIIVLRKASAHRAMQRDVFQTAIRKIAKSLCYKQLKE